MNDPIWLIIGYGVTFAAIVAYLLRLRRLEREVRREMESRGRTDA